MAIASNPRLFNIFIFFTVLSTPYWGTKATPLEAKVCNQWAIANIGNVIKKAESIGYNIEKINY